MADKEIEEIEEPTMEDLEEDLEESEVKLTNFILNFLWFKKFVPIVGYYC